MVDDKTTRYLMSAQNRKIKANQALAALRQIAWQADDRARTVNLGTDLMPVVQPSSQGGDRYLGARRWQCERC